MTTTVVDSLRSVQKATMRDITIMNFPANMKILTHISNNIDFRVPELEDLAKKQNKKLQRFSIACGKEKKKNKRIERKKVEVSIIKMNWFFQGEKNFVSFSQMTDLMPSAYYDS